MKLSIIIPVYNEEKSIKKVLAQVEEVKIPNVTKEIIVVDDGSKDKTAESIKDYLKKNKSIKLILHEKNKGKGAAVNTGIQAATGEYIIIQDADLEYNPSYIPALLKPIIQNKAQVVFGTRLDRMPNFNSEEREALFKLHYFGNRFLSLITSTLYGKWITDMETGYKVFPREALKNITLHSRSFDFEPEITAKLLKNNYSLIEVPITTNPRGYAEGKKLHAGKDGIIALWSLVKYRFVD